MNVTTPATRKYGTEWHLYHDPGSTQWKADQIQIILLQEIRDELKQLNALLNTRLRAIDRRLKENA